MIEDEVTDPEALDRSRGYERSGDALTLEVKEVVSQYNSLFFVVFWNNWVDKINLSHRAMRQFRMNNPEPIYTNGS